MTRKRGRLTSSYTRNAHNTGRTRMEFVNWASCALHLMQLQQLHGQLHRPVLHAAAACRATRLSGDWDGAGPVRSSLPWVLLQCVRELGTTYQQLPKAASSQQRHAPCVALLFCIAVQLAAIAGHGAPPPPRVRFRLLGLEKPRCRTAISTAQELIAREQMLELIFSSCLHTTLLP